MSDDGEVLRNAKPLVTSHYLKDMHSSTGPLQTITQWPENSHILLVDDNHVNQLVAKGTLESFGLTVDIAKDGLDALDALKDTANKNYTCILMDCLMPNMDGYTTTREIRSGTAGEQYKNIPIIAMTANAMKGDREKCITAGMDDYLSKPIVNESLIEKLKKFLK